MKPSEPVERSADVGPASPRGGAGEAGRLGATARTGSGVVLLAAALLAGCAGDLTSGGFGEVEVVVVGDTVTSGSSGALVGDVGGDLLSEILGEIAAMHGGPHLVGDVTVWMQTYVRRGFRQWIEVTDGVQVVNVSIPGGEVPIAIRSDFPAGAYTHVRNRFYKIEVEVIQGLDVDGTPITGTVTVNFGLQGRADAPQAIDLVVEEGSSTTLVVELRAGVWLPRLNRDTRRVDASDFLEALRVRRRAGAPPPP